MFARIFDTSEVDAFATWVVTELRKTLPPKDCEARSKKADAGVAKLNDRVARRAAELVAIHRLNAYKKAKLGTRLLTLLEDGGYPANFSKQFAYDVVALVATAATQRH